MTFDNKKTSYRIYLWKLFVTITIAVLIAAVLTIKWFDGKIFGLSQNILTLILAGIYLLLTIYNYIRDLNYFYFHDEGPNIIIRYYPLRPLSKTRRSMEIPKTVFAGYEVRNSMLGLKKILILKQFIKNKLARYPSISISSLTQDELSLLITHLEKYASGKS